MPTTTRTRPHPPHQVILEQQEEPAREMFKLRSSNILGGRTFGNTPKVDQAPTPPRQDSKSTDNPDKTPSARAKVLPWVHGIEDGTIPDGMFGPYDSTPPTRMPTIHETQPHRPHPFAYNAHESMGSVIPFHGVPPVPVKDYPGVRPESDVLGPGLYGVGPMGETMGPTRTGGSPGGDTFGGGEARPSPRKAATQLTGSPKRASPSRSAPGRRPDPPLDPLPPIPSQAPITRKPVPAEGPTQDATPADTHHANDHHFSHYEAAQKQAEALELARAQALARLEKGRGDVEDLPPSMGFNKGPRGTYETGTSGPSFGHIFHQDGQPVSARQSYQQGIMGGQPMTRDVGNAGSFFRIPFGVPLGMPLARPMMLMRTGTGTGMGIGITGMGMGPSGLDNVPEADERRRDDRSAFVETVHDEDSPIAPDYTQTHHSEMRPQTVQSRSVKNQDPARTESDAQPLDKRTNATKTTVGGLPPSFDPETYPPPAVKHSQAKTATKAPTLQSNLRRSGIDKIHKSASRPAASVAAKSARSRRAPTVGTERLDHEAKEPSIASDTRTHARTEHTVKQAAPSIAPTSASNIKRLVHDSGVHDEVLCQLLDAAKLNLIGSEAKKALQRAARARVIELRDARETQAQMQAALDASYTGPRSRDASREQALKAASATTVPPFSPPPETPDVSAQAYFVPPPRSQHAPTAAARSRAPTGIMSHHAPTLPESHRAPTIEQDIPSFQEPRAPTTAATSVPRQPASAYAPSQRAPTAPLSIATKQTPSPLLQGLGNVTDPNATPRWAKDIQSQMALLGERFTELQRQADMYAHPQSSTAHDPISGEMLDDIIFAGYPGSQMPFTPQEVPADSPQTVRGRTMTPSNIPRAQSRDVTLTWGSEVELPGGSPTKPKPMVMPTINIQPPTESNARTRVASIPSRTDPRTPAGRTVELQDVQESGMTGMAKHDKSLPATPAPDSDGRTAQPSPSSIEVGRGAYPQGYDPVYRGDTNQDSNTTDTVPNPYAAYGRPPTALTGTAPTVNGMNGRPITDRSAMTADAVTAPTHFTPTHAPVTPTRGARDVIHMREAPDAMPSEAGMEPWDAVVQRLYQWAMVWEEDSFVKALEGTALGKQVESLSLTVFMMMVYKRLLSHNLTAVPVKSCDKLFVPPLMADAINHAVHNKQFDNARQMLDELWYPWGFQQPPRVIIALAKHRNESDKWTAHRFDLSTGHLTSYGVTSENQNLPDGRPFMWWHAIRTAWPEYAIPDPDSLKQRVEYVITPLGERNDNSLKAMNYARNLLLGFRPELARDLTKLRETVWEEVKRLSNKKNSGHLMVHPDHVHGHPRL